MPSSAMVDVGGLVAHHAARIRADVGLPDVITPYHEDVGLLGEGGGRGSHHDGQGGQQSEGTGD